MSSEGFSCRRQKPKKAAVYGELFYKFLENHCQDRLREILIKDSDEPEVEMKDEATPVDDVVELPVDIKYIVLFTECPVLGEHLFNFPSIILKEGNKAVRRLLKIMCSSLKETGNVVCPERIDRVHIRIYSLPENCVSYEFTTREVGRFTCWRATVVRTTTSRIMEYSRLYKCSVCKQQAQIEAQPENYYIFPTIVKNCPNLCVGARLTPVLEKGNNSVASHSKLKDFQEIKIQEQRHKVTSGSLPKSIYVILEHDLIGKCKPGDDVEICGTLILRLKPFKSGQPIVTELAFLANHLQVINDQRSSILITEEIVKSFRDFWERNNLDPYKGRNLILASFCPQVCGLYVVKLAIAIALAGGVPREVNGTPIRGESHMLLVGDPGTGKSQLLKYASLLFPRSVITTGTGTTNAGLTVSAVKDGSEWEFEPGALVLADGGICCIDEFSCIREHDRTSIHEAMEQQSISVAKAGMLCKLNTRCIILAATNPKGKYDDDLSVAANVAVSGPLLSRFDILLVLRDSQNAGWDDFVCDFVLGGNVDKTLNLSEEIWEIEKLKAYFALIKDIKPTMSAEAIQVLSTYYQEQRNSSDRNAARTTVRLMESLVRLSEGHAKLMFRNEVTVHDALTAIILIESSTQGGYLTGTIDTLHSAFPIDAMEEYTIHAELILEKLDLKDVWKRVREDIEKKKKNITSNELRHPSVLPQQNEESEDEQNQSPVSKKPRLDES